MHFGITTRTEAKLTKSKLFVTSFLALVTVLLSSSTSCSNDQNMDYNAYIVSSELRAVPIIESEKNQAVGQAYNGFAISLKEARNDKAYFYAKLFQET